MKKTFFSKEDKDVLQKVKEALKRGFQVEWNTTYETFYGVGWASRACSQLANTPCNIKCTNLDRWEGYHRTLIITPKTA